MGSGTSEYNKKYYEANKEKIKARRAKFYRENRDRLLSNSKEWYNKNRKRERRKVVPMTNSEKCKRYYYRHKESINKQRAIYQRHKRQSDPVFAMKNRVRNMIRDAIGRKARHRTSRTAEIVGCDLNTLSEHLFATWEKNYGTKWNGEKYHIDHIVPLATAKSEEDVIRLCHYTNLQILTSEDNLKKRDKRNA